MNRFYIDWKKGLEMIRHRRASVEIAAMLVVSIFCCTVAGSYPKSWPWKQETVSVHADSGQSGFISGPDDAAAGAGGEEASDSRSFSADITQAVVETLPSEAAPPEKETPLTEAERMAQAPSSPSRLNMAYEFAPGVSGDTSESYAGKAYYMLAARDEQWVSQMYSTRQTAPGILAVSLGLTGKNLGDYSDWTNVGLLFYDGDGSMISGYSNAREILAMANVYSYFHPFESAEEFYEYAEQLWKASHKYVVLASDVYFCEGECKYNNLYVNEDDSDAAWADPEGIAPVAGSSSEETAADGSSSAAGNNGPLGPLGPLKPAVQTSSDTANTEAQPEGSSAAAETEGAVGTIAAETTAANETGGQSDTAAETSAETSAPVGPLGPLGAASNTETIADAGADTNASGTASGTPETAAQNVAETTQAAETTAAQNASETVPETAPETAAPEIAASSAPAGPLGPLGPLSVTEPSEEASTGSEPAPEETLPAAANAETGAESSPSGTADSASGSLSAAEGGESSGDTGETKCKGHVDLTIRATIIGLKESRNNLYHVDVNSDSEEDYTDSWKGWTMLRKRYVQNLLDQDWFELYGLTAPASMYIQNPLTAAEIQYYMNMMPEDTSDDRKALVRQALQSVGYIPYYWGGKPSGPGYEPNGFGTLVAPDESGRSLRGLDCSGWISWLYWTALGRHLPYESTEGLYALGRQVDRSELKPGDYIVRTGDDAHVCLFLAWAPDGTMYVIHERGSSSNNVIVSNYDLYWPYYRNLLD